MRLQRYYQEILTSSQESSRVSIILGWSPQYSTGKGCQEKNIAHHSKMLIAREILRKSPSNYFFKKAFERPLKHPYNTLEIFLKPLTFGI